MTESEIKEHNEKCRNRRIWDWFKSAVQTLDHPEIGLLAFEKLKHLIPPCSIRIERDVKVSWKDIQVTLFLCGKGCMIQYGARYFGNEDAIDKLAELLS